MENVPIRMRVVYKGQRVEFTTGYRIDVAKWDTNKQRVKNGCTGMFSYFRALPGFDTTITKPCDLILISPTT